jgi:hypothetical protein
MLVVGVVPILRIALYVQLSSIFELLTAGATRSVAA